MEPTLKKNKLTLHISICGFVIKTSNKNHIFTDCFSDITLARQGYPRMAIAACFGGIIFSILDLTCMTEFDSNIIVFRCVHP